MPARGGGTDDAGNIVQLEEEVDKDYDPTEQEVVEYAEWLGMDVENDRDLLWIAKQGLKAPLPHPWKPCQTAEDGEVFYFNYETGESVWDHPCDDYHRKLYKTEQAKKNGGTAPDSELDESASESGSVSKNTDASRSGRAPPSAPGAGGGGSAKDDDSDAAGASFSSVASDSAGGPGDSLGSVSGSLSVDDDGRKDRKSKKDKKEKKEKKDKSGRDAGDSAGGMPRAPVHLAPLGGPSKTPQLGPLLGPASAGIGGIGGGGHRAAELDLENSLEESLESIAEEAVEDDVSSPSGSVPSPAAGASGRSGASSRKDGSGARGGSGSGSDGSEGSEDDDPIGRGPYGGLGPGSLLPAVREESSRASDDAPSEDGNLPVSEDGKDPRADEDHASPSPSPVASASGSAPASAKSAGMGNVASALTAVALREYRKRHAEDGEDHADKEHLLTMRKWHAEDGAEDGDGKQTGDLEKQKEEKAAQLKADHEASIKKLEEEHEAKLKKRRQEIAEQFERAQDSLQDEIAGEFEVKQQKQAREDRQKLQSELAAQKEKLQSQLDESAEAEKAAAKAAEELRTKLKDAEDECEKLRASAADSPSSSPKSSIDKGEIAELQDRVAEMEDERDELQAKAEEAKKKGAEASPASDDLRAELAELRKEAQTLRSELAEAGGGAMRTGEKAAQRIRDLADEQAAKTSSQLQAKVEQLEKDRGRLERELQDLTSERDAARVASGHAGATEPAVTAQLAEGPSRRWQNVSAQVESLTRALGGLTSVREMQQEYKRQQKLRQ